MRPAGPTPDGYSDDSDSASPESEFGASSGVRDILEQVARSRRVLLSVARRVSETAWDRVLQVGDEGVRPLEYMDRIVQYDASVLRRIAERIYESRPTGSPGFTAG